MTSSSLIYDRLNTTAKSRNELCWIQFMCCKSARSKPFRRSVMLSVVLKRFAGVLTTNELRIESM